MPIPDPPSYSHGSTGTKPATALDKASGDTLDADNFDYFIYTEFSKLKALIDALEALDSDDDGRVDAADHATNADHATSADSATNADTATTAGTADEAKSFEARTEYPSNPSAGRVVFRTDKT